jgi:hypothetical protein
MKKNSIFTSTVTLAVMFLALQFAAAGQDQEPAQTPPPLGGAAGSQSAPQQDPPGRVARLSFFDGSVSFQPGGQGDWVQAVRNRALTTGDNLWADKDSRAEIQVGSTSLRVDSETSITILQLDDRVTQIRLSAGSIILRVRHLDDEDHMEIDTPNLAFQIQRTGEYRLDAAADGKQTNATVWNGRGEAVGGGSSFVVVAGQRATFSGTDQLNHEIDQIPASDDFDNWAFGRDRDDDRTEASNYISPEMTGYQDLDQYGTWSYVAPYGPVWTPVGVAPGWAPYQYGHWVWVSPWGWTWVEDEPWGFAPFHYGRWAYVGPGWCWVPGPVYVRPVYAPAMVTFVGGPGYPFAGGPGVGWFPLGPREVYMPWYGAGRGYVNNVNVTNTNVSVTNITNVYNIYNSGNTTAINNIHYANRNAPGGITAVSRETFVNARPVQSNLAKVNPKDLESAPITRTLSIQPDRQSVLGAGRTTSAKPPAAIENRQVVAIHQPMVMRNSAIGREPSMSTRTVTPTEPERQAGSAQAPRTAQPPNNRLEEQGTPEPEQPAHAEEPSRAAEPARPPEPSYMGAPVPRPQGYGTGHPLVREAPPVENRPEFQRSEEEKFNNWQRNRPPSESVSRPQPSRPQAPSRPR